MPDFEKLKADYAARWAAMDIRPEWAARARQKAEKVLAARRHYEPVSGATGVPWAVIGIIHIMEADGNFKCHLHNGDPLSAKTRQVPKGRPLKGSAPFKWEESACDALVYDGLDKVKDWSPERLAWCLEKFNGFGSRNRGVPSAYLWSGTDQYTKGKYIADGVWDGNHVSQQVGGMAILKALLELDPSIDFEDDAPAAAAAFPKAEKEVHAEVAALPAPKEMVASSRKYWLIERVKTWLFGGGIATLIGGKAANDAGANDPYGIVQALFVFAKTNGVYVIIATLIGGYILFEVIQHLMRKDKAEGRYQPSGEAQ